MNAPYDRNPAIVDPTADAQGAIDYALRGLSLLSAERRVESYLDAVLGVAAMDGDVDDVADVGRVVAAGRVIAAEHAFDGAGDVQRIARARVALADVSVRPGRFASAALEMLDEVLRDWPSRKRALSILAKVGYADAVALALVPASKAVWEHLAWQAHDAAARPRRAA